MEKISRISYLTDSRKKNLKIDEGTLINSTNKSVDPYDYHIANYDERAFKAMESNVIHCFQPNEVVDEEEEDEDIWRNQRKLDEWV